MKQKKLLGNFFNPFLQRYQEELEEPIRGREFVFHSIDLLCYKLHKVSRNRDGSYIDSPEWLKNKKATINPKNNDDKFFQYALTVALNSSCIKIKSNRERISNIKTFIGQYNWKEIDFPSHRKHTGKSLNQIINQLLLISYMYLKILKK